MDEIVDKQIEEMEKCLTDFFDNTPMELSFVHADGNRDIIAEQKALKVLDDIIRQAVIPCFAVAFYNAGYRRKSQTADEIERQAWKKFFEDTTKKTAVISLNDLQEICKEVTGKTK